MARRPEGWKLKLDPRTNIYIVRFTLGGKRILRSTGERDLGRAKVAAVHIYVKAHQDTQAGEGGSSQALPATAGLIASRIALDELCSHWLAALEGSIDEATRRSYTLYVKRHWRPFFATLASITEARADAYVRERLRKVRRTTLLKELSALRGFLTWCRTEGHLREVPTVRSPPRSATGVDHDGGKRKKVRVEISEEEAVNIIAKLPERTSHGKLPAWAFFTTMYETTLRRGTLFAIRSPEDYTRGSKTLLIRDEADKVRFGRELPLSRRARAALDSVCPAEGLIFGVGHYRYVLRAAAKAAGLSEHRARHLSYHDWRHAALTHMASTTTDLVGMAFLAGHKDVATTARYVHANRKAAERVIAAREEKQE